MHTVLDKDTIEMEIVPPYSKGKAEVFRQRLRWLR